MKDIRLELLLKAYQDAKRLGFSDGAGKVLSCRLIDAVITLRYMLPAQKMLFDVRVWLL